MNELNDDELARLARTGLEKCMQRMTEVSPGVWQLAAVRVFCGEVRGAIRGGEREGKPASAIRIRIKGAIPFITAIIFSPEDIRHISRCFAEEIYFGPVSEAQPDVTVIEIGNILLNMLVNSLLRGLKKSAVPSVPAHFQGDCGSVEKWLGAGPGPFTIISAKFTMQREGSTACAEIFAFLPQQLIEQEPPAP